MNMHDKTRTKAAKLETIHRKQVRALKYGSVK